MKLLNKNILVSGASIAGLSTAYWLAKLGCKVTVVEIASELRTAGAAVDLRETAIEIANRMGIVKQLEEHKLGVELVEFKNADDITEGSIKLINEGEEVTSDEIEIERDKFLGILFDKLESNVEFMFNDSIIALEETTNNINVVFKNGFPRSFDLVIGCDGMHSAVRRIWFGQEKDYTHFLQAYFSISTVNKLLIKQKTMQMFNVPDKAITLNAYNNKTDIILCFFSEKEISYNYRDNEWQRKVILEQFAGAGWKTEELLQEMQQSNNFYFDKFAQVKMPSWTKGRVALVGDAGYCASPAAGMGGSLAMIGATALCDALQKYNGNYELAFQEYNTVLRPFIEKIQAGAELNVKENFIPRTEEAIRKRNASGF